MAIPQTIPQIIADAQISLYLATTDVQRGGLFPRPVNKNSPSVIYTEMKSVEWAYNQNNNFTDITATSNYLYWLLAPYNLQAIYIRTNGGGGVIPPINPPTFNLQPLEFIVSDSTQIPTGGNTFTFDTAPYDYRGFNLQFNRGNQPQGQINNGSNYFTYNKVTGVFQCFDIASAGEDFQFYPSI